jgi:4-hydroxy-2-oxoheptanedioate aldolase
MVDLRARLHDGKPFLFSWMTIPGAQLAGQVARLPFDAVTLDLQHGLIDFGDAVAMVSAIAAAGKPVIVRTLWNDPGLVGQALDCGASVIIAPMVNSRAQAEALVKAAKYPPGGQRSWGGYAMVQVAKMTPGEYLKAANTSTLVFAMIETREALDALDDIATVPGLDGLFVGPSDLSIALSDGEKLDRLSTDTLTAMDKVAAACKRNGLVAGAFAGNPEIMKKYMAKGFNFLAAVVDNDLLRQGAEAALAGVRE